MTDKTLFVFYTFAQKSYWTYNKFPNGWKWVGSGRTTPICSNVKEKYTNEEQFSGPAENNDKMVIFLEKTFKKLEEEKIIKFFKIQENYR